MAVNQGSAGVVEEQIYKFITNTLGYNTAVACGILANAEAESSFNPAAVGDGGAAYGIFQWNSRREDLFKYAGGNTSPSVQTQLGFLKYELENTETKFSDKVAKGSYSNTADGARDAGDDFCTLFERPSNSESKGDDRGEKAKDTYWVYYSKNPSAGDPLVPNLGATIIEKAREVINHDPQIPYVWGGKSLEEGFDCSGFVWYCYTQAGVDYTYRTSAECYEYYKDTAKSVDSNATAAGDLLFYIESGGSEITHIAIANGEGGRVHAASSSTGIVEDDSLGSPNYILRILSDAETSRNSNLTYDGMMPPEYISLTINDPYSLNMIDNLSKVKASGYDYGYLIDVTHGGEFKFYIPEFSEQAGANWSEVDIRGRSVSVLSYENTSSRSVTVSLDLYAGEGVYKPVPGETGEGVINRLHRDASFLKSLEYPDYSSAIATPPPTVHLILGPVVSFIGVVSDVSVEHLKPLDSQNRSMYIKVDFKVTQIAGNPPDYRDIRNGQYALVNTEDRATLMSTVYDSIITNAPIFTNTEKEAIIIEDKEAIIIDE